MKRESSKYFTGIMIMLLAILVVFRKSYVKKAPGKPSSNKKDIELSYRTTDALDSSQNPYPYEFHKGGSIDERRCQSYSAVIRNIDPLKDDYKTYCRAVITDIVKRTGDKIVVNIYDDYEAYQLSEIKDAQQYKVLTRDENDTVNKHTIAIYYGAISDYQENAHTLWYYREANNRFTEKERFEP